MAKKQKALPGMEREVHEEVDVAAEVYVKTRDKRVKLTEHEVADKAALIAAMQKHKLTVYKDEERGLVITLTPGKTGVKVQELKDDEAADDEAEAA